MVGMVIGGGFYGYVIGIIATLVAVSVANARAYNEKMGVVNAWLEFNDLPRDLRDLQKTTRSPTRLARDTSGQCGTLLGHNLDMSDLI